MPVANWSKSTPVNNGTVDQTRDVKFYEGILARQLNDSARALMAEIKKFIDDNDGSLTTTGTGTAYVVATNQLFTSPFATLVDGITLVINLHAVPGAAATLKVDDLTAKPLVLADGTALPAGNAGVGQRIGVRYNQSLDAWMITRLEPASLTRGGVVELATAAEARAQADAQRAITPAALQSVLPIGTRMPFYQAAAPTGWTQLTDAAINDAAIRLVNGTGGGTGGSAGFAATFASRTPAGTVGSTVLSEANLPAHRHALINNTSSPGIGLGTANFVAVQGASAGDDNYILKASNSEPAHGLSSEVGSGTGHAHSFTGTAMDFAVKYCNFIICERTAA